MLPATLPTSNASQMHLGSTWETPIIVMLFGGEPASIHAGLWLSASKLSHAHPDACTSRNTRARNSCDAEASRTQSWTFTRGTARKTLIVHHGYAPGIYYTRIGMKIAITVLRWRKFKQYAVYCNSIYLIMSFLKKKPLAKCGGGPNTTTIQWYSRVLVLRERVLFIGTEFSILYTFMHSPA